MITFPNCKINIGLRILRKRTDGYHDIWTLMVPVPWCDILEMVPAKGPDTTLTVYGSDLGGCPPEKNLVMKALRALEEYTGTPLPHFDIYLHKIIPDGAGLGGGSSDASATLKLANELADLKLDNDALASVAAKVGADCPFFIYDSPMVAEGIGERLHHADVPALKGLGLAIVKPRAEAVATRDAYAAVAPRPMPTGVDMDAILRQAPAQWQAGGVLVNDFQQGIFALRPQIARAMERLAAKGAIYYAMSGSGAAVFGLFPTATMAENAIADFDDCNRFACSL